MLSYQPNRIGPLVILLAMVLGASALRPASAQLSLGTDFTYQGVLRDASGPANGTFDFEFNLFDVAEFGSPLGAALELADVQVTDGVFTVSLDFGATTFSGSPRYLEISVRPGAGTDLPTILRPRQLLKAVPFAQVAINAQSATLADMATIAGSADFATSTSLAAKATMADMATTADNATTASFALNADMLDSLDSTDFAAAAHAHSSLDGSAGSPTDALVVTSIGNVGIGTASPADLLHVVGGDMTLEDSTPVLTLEATSATGNTVLDFQSQGTRQAIIFHDGDDNLLRISESVTGTRNDLVITDAGLMGKNIAAPQSDIHIEQSDSSTGTGGIIFEYNLLLGNSEWQIGNTGSNNFYWHFDDHSGSGFVSKAFINKADGSFNVFSDLRMKKNVEPLGETLDKVMEIGPVLYHLKGTDDSEPRSIGVIAQDVEKTFPSLVTASEDGLKGVNYSAFGVLAIKAIQEQQVAFEAQSRIVEAQGLVIEELRAAIDRLRMDMEAR